MPTISQTDKGHTEEAITVEQIKKETIKRRLRAARSLAARMQITSDGSRAFIRFSRSQSLEHWILLVSFGTLAVTGLLQSFSAFFPIGWIIQILGNVETVRTIHRLAAIVLAVLSFYHGWRILETWFVKQERGGMWPRIRDFRDLVQMVMFNAGLAKKRPEFDRFTIEEKLEYWALLWGTPVMGLTGLVLWVPAVVTSVLPGQIYPIAQAIHRWEAILASLAILTWHMYHGCLKDRNRSVFTGIMSEEEMQHAHPLEYRRIVAAHEYLQKVTTEEGPPRSEVALKKDHQEAAQGLGQTD
ncbi:MAG: cytochrome b/b6 domain-containing protein [Chloroflexi bacterium]|nr:cytochrome b/b6 domain-containing protein [Chloroflexota bacterium]